jgi:hypothetical protein
LAYEANVAWRGATMILAPSRKFIFIHVPKAAGTSINSALSMHDAFFPVRMRPAARRAHAESIGLPASAADLGEHASARHIIAALGRDAYDSYYSFAFVRNPWDVAVSWFHYRLINPDQIGHQECAAAGSFEKYVAQVLTRPDGVKQVGPQHPYVLDADGKRAVSYVGRYESLAEDFATVKQHLGIETLVLDHFNQSYHPPWPSLYTGSTFEIVGALVAKDAALFGYSTDAAAYGIR